MQGLLVGSRGEEMSCASGISLAGYARLAARRGRQLVNPQSGKPSGSTPWSGEARLGQANALVLPASVIVSPARCIQQTL